MGLQDSLLSGTAHAGAGNAVVRLINIVLRVPCSLLLPRQDHIRKRFCMPGSRNSSMLVWCSFKWDQGPEARLTFTV